jgi:Flagellar hook-length control protein FliK
MTTDRTQPARPAAPTDRSAAAPAERPGKEGAFAALLDAHAPRRETPVRRDDTPRREDAPPGDDSQRPDQAPRPQDVRPAATPAQTPVEVAPAAAPAPSVPTPELIGFAGVQATEVAVPEAAVPATPLPKAPTPVAPLPFEAAPEAHFAPVPTAPAPAPAAVTPAPAAPAPAPTAAQPLPAAAPQATVPTVPTEATAAPAAPPAAAPAPALAPAVPQTAPVVAEPAAQAPVEPAAPEAPATPQAAPARAAAPEAAAPAPFVAAPAGEPVGQAPTPTSAPLSGPVAPERAVPLHRAPAAVATLLHVAAERGITHAKMALRPAELGGIEIRLQASAAGVAAQVVADSPEAAKLLAQASDDLRRALEAREVTLISLEVSTTADDRSQRARGEWTDGDDAGAFSGSGRASTDDDAEPAPTSRTVIELPGGLLVDVLA